MLEIILMLSHTVVEISRTKSLTFLGLHSHPIPVPIWNLHPIPIFFPSSKSQFPPIPIPIPQLNWDIWLFMQNFFCEPHACADRNQQC